MIPGWFNCASSCAASRARFPPRLSGLEIDLVEREALLGAERIGVRGQICAQLGVGRLDLGRNVAGEEFHLLSQPAADDDVVFVQSQRQGLAVVDLLSHPVADQALPILAGRRPLPRADEDLPRGRELASRDDDPPGRGGAAAIQQAVAGEDQGAEHDEVNERFLEQSLRLDMTENTEGTNSSLSLDHFPGAYQMGEV